MSCYHAWIPSKMINTRTEESCHKTLVNTIAVLPGCLMLTIGGFPSCHMLIIGEFPGCLMLTIGGFLDCPMLTIGGFPAYLMLTTGRFPGSLILTIGEFQARGKKQILGSAWIPVDTRGFPYIPVDPRGSPWIPVDPRGFWRIVNLSHESADECNRACPWFQECSPIQENWLNMMILR